MHAFIRNTFFSIFLTGIILLLISGILFYQQFQRMLTANENSAISYETLRAANSALNAIHEASLEAGSFLQNDDDEALKNLPEIIIVAQINLSTLGQITQDDKYQQLLFKELTPYVTQKFAFYNKIITQFQAGDKAGALATAGDKGRIPLTKQINQLIGLIKQIEVNQLNGFTNDYKHLANKSLRFLTCTGILCELLFLFSYIGLRKYTK